MTETKKCTKCKESKPVEQYDYINIKRNKRKRGQCKDCRQVYNKIYYEDKKTSLILHFD